MYPGLMLVCDPRPGAADADLAFMLEQYGLSPDHKRVRSGRGERWAGAAITPAANEPSCGAGVCHEHGHTLIWVGDVFLPDAWAGRQAAGPPRRAIGGAILRRLTSHGVESLADIDGAFCGAWYDPTRRCWTLFNDRLGQLPTFWAAEQSRLVVAPKARLAWQASGLPLAIDEDGVTDVIRAMNTTEDRTLIRQVHWLIGGHALRWMPSEGATSRRDCRPYWEFRHHSSAYATPAEAVDAYVEVLTEAMRRHASSIKPPMLGISGGMDSRMILAICSTLSVVPACFTTGWPFSEDVRFGRQLARLAGAAHEVVPMEAAALARQLERLIIDSDGLHGARHLGGGFGLQAFLAGHPGAVLLEGHLHGIVGGAYVPSDGDIPDGRSPHDCYWAAKYCHGGGSIALINELCRPDLARRSLERWQALIDDRFARAPTSNPLEQAEYVVFTGRSGRNDVLGPMLLRRDVALRSPATDRAMLDWMAATPASWRRGKQLVAEALRRHFPRFARVPRANHSGFPIAEDRLRREYCWQRDKLHRWWTHCRYPETRTWGMAGEFLTAWLFETWRKTSGAGGIREADARILEWVQPEALDRLWSVAERDPRQAGVLLTLATIETMVRRLERLPGRTGPSSHEVRATVAREPEPVVAS
ncbi:MAG: hypothetical protein KA354_21200 [Phycisphaerae bacterium]|nr:hypothetical protein [Phycisphaerae bacterium]